MKDRSGCGWMVLLAGLLSGAAAAAPTAKEPAFNCAKASGTVQKLICSDDALAAQDRTLDGVYKAALAKSRGAMRNTLKAEQRGWIKGRDECWKAQAATPTWLTESWTVDSVRACVDAQYQLRTAELQVRWQLVASSKPLAYGCNNNPANEVTVQFFDSALPAGRFERGDQSVVAYRVQTASGARYEGRNLSFWSKGSEATIKWLAEELSCTEK